MASWEQLFAFFATASRFPLSDQLLGKYSFKAHIWSRYTKRSIEKLEKVQRRATKFILKTEDYYDSRLKKLNLSSLEKRQLLSR